MIRLLGSVEVVSPAGRAVLSGSKQPAIVGLLALRAGEVVSGEALIDALWGLCPPRTALRSLHSHVSRVRQAFSEIGLGEAVVTCDPGYLLAIDRSEVDCLRFGDLVRQARQATAEDALRYLEQALQLWRGEVMQDCRPVEWGAGEIALLAEERLAAIEERWRLEIKLGHGAQAIGELERLVNEQPLREPLWELLMDALARLGRRGDALAAYQRARAVLVGELGVEPGPGLRDRQAQLLAEEPIPQQLPAPPQHFAGRERELDQLAELDSRVVVIAGQPGQGKTALAIQHAHRVKAGFPDGQVFVDLCGHDPESALRPQDVLVHLLRAMGVSAEQLTVDRRQLESRYQAMVADRRLLLIFDNVGSSDQLSGLIPASGPSRLLVTTRNRLLALMVEHSARFLSLEPLDDRSAEKLLHLMVGKERVERESVAAMQLVQFCGRLPLALRIAAARLAFRPQLMLKHLVAELADEAERLTALEIEDSGRSIRAAFASSYAALPQPLARTFRLMSCNPGATICLPAVAAVAGLSQPQARRAADGLTAAHLLEEVASERFAFHDLIRLFAAERLTSEEGPPERAAALLRLLQWQAGLVAAGSRILRPYRDRMAPDRPLSSHDLPFAPETDAVLDFFDHEHRNLVPLVRSAVRAGQDRLVAQLAYHAHTFCRYRYTAEMVDLATEFLAAAQRLADPAVEVIALTDLGSCHRLLRQHDAALPALWRAVTLARQIGDAREEANALNSIGVLHADRGDYELALQPYQLALELLRQTGNAMAQGMVLNNIGYAQANLGRHAEALHHLQLALALHQESGDLARQGIVHDSLGATYLRRGDHASALAHLEQALELKRAGGDLRTLVTTLEKAGEVHLARGDADAARGLLEQALALTRQLGDSHGEAAVARALGELPKRGHNSFTTIRRYPLLAR
ncbi:AfsR/SARP family transcriptional regulator [Rhizocola hellebori]|nr:BTAD domain-containing putative transcriptional regulator [Rhizocola hellebori]